MRALVRPGAGTARRPACEPGCTAGAGGAIRCGAGRTWSKPGQRSSWQRTLTLGGCAAGGAALVVLTGHWAVRRVVLRRRMAEWDRAWARIEPQWTRREV
ncbi:hypothetical protein GCM10023220_16220 [Streptomyces ziwulingensis]|uniref:Uncharacterized protein n=1 Tax=Streptomyces ziwulingensis TaxID=1045501 RepID=A0ABP9BAN1_9ACTN